MQLGETRVQNVESLLPNLNVLGGVRIMDTSSDNAVFVEDYGCNFVRLFEECLRSGLEVKKDGNVRGCTAD